MKRDLSKMACLLVLVFICVAIATGCALKYNPATNDIGFDITMTTEEFMDIYNIAKDWIEARDVTENKRIFTVNGKRVQLVKE